MYGLGVFTIGLVSGTGIGADERVCTERGFWMEVDEGDERILSVDKFELFEDIEEMEVSEAVKDELEESWSCFLARLLLFVNHVWKRGEWILSCQRKMW